PLNFAAFPQAASPNPLAPSNPTASMHCSVDCRDVKRVALRWAGVEEPGCAKRAVCAAGGRGGVCVGGRDGGVWIVRGGGERSEGEDGALSRNSEPPGGADSRTPTEPSLGKGRALRVCSPSGGLGSAGTEARPTELRDPSGQWGGRPTPPS